MAGKQKFFGNHKFRVMVEKPNAANGFKARYEERIARVDVEVDIQGIIAQLGDRAIHNKSKHSSEIGGLVVVKVSKESRA